MKVGEGGRTFGSVSSKEIAEAVKEQMHLDIDKKKIQLKEQIKNTGNTYRICKTASGSDSRVECFRERSIRGNRVYGSSD